MELLSFVNKLSIRYTEYSMICARIDQLADNEYYPRLLVSDKDNIKNAIHKWFDSANSIDEAQILQAIDIYFEIRKEITGE